MAPSVKISFAKTGCVFNVQAVALFYEPLTRILPIATDPVNRPGPGSEFFVIHDAINPKRMIGR